MSYQTTIATDQVTQASLGTGVAETRLNADTSYVIPSWARQLIEFTPQQYPTGAVTASQSFTPKFKIKSISIGGMEPKELYNMYFAKAEENVNRQKNQY